MAIPPSTKTPKASSLVKEPISKSSFYSGASEKRLCDRIHQSQPGYIKTAVMGITGFILALVAWEGILRLAVESSQGAFEHPALGKIEKAGAKVHTREGFSRLRLNSLGMRAAEPQPKVAGEYRILLLGDSYTRADEVSDGLNFSDRLQALFDQSPQIPNRPKVSVINAGKPGASPASYLYAANFHNQTFAPDSTVIQLTDHDFTMDMNNPISEFYAERTGDDQSFVVRRNQAFGSSDPLAQAIAKHAPAFQPLTQLSVLRVGGRNLHAMLSPAAKESAEATPIGTDAEAAAELAIEAEDAALASWTVKALKQEFDNVVLVFIPSMSYQDAGKTSSVPRNAALESALAAAAAEAGLPFLNMRTDFLAHYRTEGTSVRGFSNTVPGQGHLNPTGHRLVAQRLAAYYRQSGLLAFDRSASENLARETK
ncbi:MAG: SGNH/GDSL hydrolase family protein [Phormidesmis sp.]